MNPNELVRKAASSEITLREVFARYQQHLITRKQKPATPDTLRVLDRACLEILTVAAGTQEKNELLERHLRHLLGCSAARWRIAMASQVFSPASS